MAPPTMYEIEIEDTFCAAHRLPEHAGKCANLHGHNWRIEVGLRGPELDRAGLLMDFADLKRITRAVIGALDHTDLNAHPSFQEVSPSAENLSRWIFEEIRGRLPQGGVELTHVRVHETDRYRATYRPASL